MGIEEFACGALNDENARMGVSPGSAKGTDPNGLIVQPYTSPTPRGGFVLVSVDRSLQVDFFTADGTRLYGVSKTE